MYDRLRYIAKEGERRKGKPKERWLRCVDSAEIFGRQEVFVSRKVMDEEPARIRR